ncbi:hypothetical protein ILUMI_05650 [Ignelater luminosus]|uniref:SAP domain-containing protein n=1 Tax=Ignelater luminosus TaxID=2038154 RepID=A0A8K0DAP9_IGNLU|nr:hypothetical protein ILUMI_05650 [Ignelater luminosus]
MDLKSELKKRNLEHRGNKKDLIRRLKHELNSSFVSESEEDKHLRLSPLYSWIRQYVQDEFKPHLGLLVDMSKQQSGNTNDGNTARKFSGNAEKSAEITGVNVELIKRFHIIVESVKCGFPIDLDPFEKYTQMTRGLYLKEYFWYSMSIAVHTVMEDK